MQFVFDPITLAAILILAWSERRFHAQFKTVDEKKPGIVWSVPRFKGSYRFVSPSKERAKELEKQEALPHPSGIGVE